MRKRYRTIKASAGVVMASAIQFETVEGADSASRRRFHQVAYTGGLMVVPGYSAPVVLDLSGAVLASKRPILLEHDKKRIVAQSDRVEVVDNQLIIAGVMLGSESAQEVQALADQGFEWQASVGANPTSTPVVVRAGQKISVNNQELEGPFILIRQWSLGESSFVLAGADGSTSSRVGAPMGVAASASAWWQNSIPADTVAVHVPNKQVTASAIECALLRTMGVGARTEKAFTPQINEAADAMKGIGLHGTFQRVLAANGGSPVYEAPALYTAACQAAKIQAANSTVSLPSIFSNVLNKAILAQMNIIPTVYQNYCKVDSAVDFKSKDYIRLSGVGGFQRVTVDGELKEFRLTDGKYSAALTTWGSIMGLTRNQLINDDMGAFAQLPEIFGRASQLAIEQEFFTKLLAWFDSSNTLPLPAAGHPLNPLGSLALGPTNMAALQWAMQWFRDQVDSQGLPMLTTPVSLLVPTSLEVPALQCMKEVTANTPAGTNVMSGMFRVDVSPYLNNAKITNYSQKNWMLFADPAVLAGMICLFLNGNSSPTFESSEMDFDVVGGMRWRGYWDFSFSGAEKQAGVIAKPT